MVFEQTTNVDSRILTGDVFKADARRRRRKKIGISTLKNDFVYKKMMLFTKQKRFCLQKNDFVYIKMILFTKNDCVYNHILNKDRFSLYWRRTMKQNKTIVLTIISWIRIRRCCYNFLKKEIAVRRPPMLILSFY